ncbi:MAG: hypothetical protein IT317_21400 [Anaerolineales bacterium]|nr:hypothetical protein [Anaerolineales bacterium]
MNKRQKRRNEWRRLAIVLTLTLLLVSPVIPAQASNPHQDDPPSGSASVQPLVELVTNVARLFIQFFVFSSVAVFAVSVARGFWSAQIANLVGSPMGVSQAWLNIIAAVFIFILAVMSTTFVGIVFDAVRGYVDTSIPIPQF